MTSSEHPDYRPIACSIYSRLEVAILHRTPIGCTWTDTDGRRHEARLLPLDLRTRDHAEYLIAEAPEGQVEIRLDRVSHWQIDGEEIDPGSCSR
jgi:Rho-binding antiterminator